MTSTTTQSEIAGTRGKIVVHRRSHPQPRYVALVAHGYGEHAGRYEHVFDALAEHGAAVFAPDHFGHGLSDGERALVSDLDAAIEDLHRVSDHASAGHGGLPIVLIGHSMGGLISARYAQVHGDGLSALVLSSPALAADPAMLALVDLDPIPAVPIDPEVLSRDPAVGEAYAADPLVYHGPFTRLTLETLGGAMQAVAAGGRLGALPTFWIHGTDDALVPYSGVREAIASIRGDDFSERAYEGGRHESFNEINRDDVIAEVLGFIDSAL